VPGQEIQYFATPRHRPPDLRPSPCYLPPLSHPSTPFSHLLSLLQPTRAPTTNRPLGLGSPRRPVLLAGVYLGIKKHTGKYATFMYLEIRNDRDQKPTQRGISKVSDKEKQRASCVKEIKKKTEARRPPCKDRTAALNEGINESMPAGYLEMQIRFRPTKMVLLWLLRVRRPPVLSSLYFSMGFSSSVRPRES